MAGSGRFAGAFGAAGAGSGGFRWVGRCADGVAQLSKPSADAGGGELMRLAGSFPGQPVVVDEAASEAELCERGDDQPRPVVGLSGCAQRRGGPAEGVLGEPEGVFDVEAAQVGAPAQIEVGSAGSGPPQPQRLFGSGGRFGQVLDVDTDDGAVQDWLGVVVGPVSASP